MTTEIFVRNQLNYDLKQASDESVVPNTEPSLTQQHLAEGRSCREMLENFMNHGIVPPMSSEAHYGDFTETGGQSHHELLNILIEARMAFENMSISVRDEFGNNLGEFLSWVSDPENEKEVIDFFEKGEYTSGNSEDISTGSDDEGRPEDTASSRTNKTGSDLPSDS